MTKLRLLSKLKLLYGFAAIALMGLPQVAQADSHIVGLSPFGDPAQGEMAIRRHVQFAVEGTQPGDELVFVDAYNTSLLCRFQVPENAAYQHPKAKLKANGACIGALMAFVRARTLDLPSGSIRLPQFLSFVGETHDMERYASVIVEGSPIYHDPHEPRFSMEAARVPSDGHISAPRTETPYSAQGAHDLLSGTPVHWTSEGLEWDMNNKHGVLVERFWTLLVHSMGGVLTSFDVGRDLMFRRVMENAKPVSAIPQADSSTKLEMAPVRIERFAGVPIYERALSSGLPSRAEISAATNVEIGIRWEGCEACDLDVYVQPYRGAEVLYFGRTHSREGTFYKDFTSASSLANGLESVAFQGPIDLSRTLIAVNLYRGHVPDGVSGEVRIAIGGQTYAASFAIKGPEGSGGVGRNQLLNTRTAPSNAWTLIDPLDVVGLRN